MELKLNRKELFELRLFLLDINMEMSISHKDDMYDTLFTLYRKLTNELKKLLENYQISLSQEEQELIRMYASEICDSVYFDTTIRMIVSRIKEETTQPQ